MKAKEQARAAGPLVGGARAGAPGGTLWVDWLAARGRGSEGALRVHWLGRRWGRDGLQRARAFVAVMEETGAVFRKVREGVLAGRAGGGGRGFRGWGIAHTDRRGRCDPGSPA